jgi:hypothetical protein
MTEVWTVAVLPGAVKGEVFVGMDQLGLYAAANGVSRRANPVGGCGPRRRSQTVIVVDKEFSLDAGGRQD